MPKTNAKQQMFFCGAFGLLAEKTFFAANRQRRTRNLLCLSELSCELLKQTGRQNSPSRSNSQEKNWNFSFLNSIERVTIAIKDAASMDLTTSHGSADATDVYEL
ncbi:unnamed protein product [Ceratitis capitata]|uniref:(Mediterranean fruit fly) hypothetical protein n=1 Tax=Ceratitis capitata TaxID=7213 RepID=A0A811UT80_CERCA|nr:unnamed protein product [Ceratitis capitata]